MKTEKDYKIIETMMTYGGSFVKGLAEAFLHADPINFEILKNAFPKYWKEYKGMAEDNIK